MSEGPPSTDPIPELMTFFREFGELEQAKMGRDRDSEGAPLPHLPIFVWRFAANDRFLDGAVAEALDSFKGQLRWRLRPGAARKGEGINTVMAPVRYFEVREELLGQPEPRAGAAHAILEREPEIIDAALADLPELVRHIKEHFARTLPRRAP